MTLIDDTYDCCGRRFDPMGDPLLIRGAGFDVFCQTCRPPKTTVLHEHTERLNALLDDVIAHAERMARKLERVREHVTTNPAHAHCELHALLAEQED